MEYAFLSDAGLYRMTNEDRAGVFTVSDVFTVALLLDGMGGVSGGMVASRMAYDTMATELELRLSFLLCEEGGITHRAVGDVLRAAASEANKAVYEHARQNAELRGMGTTLVVAVFYGKHCCILNVGDSRAYYFAEGQMTQVTKDQSYLQYLLDHDKISEKDVGDFKEKNVIMSAVGTEYELKSDLYYLSFTDAGTEQILLCSDGLHDYVSEETIRRTVNKRRSLDVIVSKLIDAAYDGGGEDNISAVLVRI